MTDFTTHPDSLFDAGKPALGSTFLEMRDNLVATGEGAAGAPSMVPNYGAHVVAGEVGTYVLARYTGGGNIAFGANVPGSLLEPASAVFGGAVGDLDFATGAPLSGTWVCMGEFVDSQDMSSGQDTTIARGVTLWARMTV